MKTRTYSFPGSHTITLAGTQIIYVTFGLRNLDLYNPMTIERLTIRDLFGNVASDTGPVTPNAHPLNSDITPNLNITVVPPGAAYYLNTTHIFGLAALPAGNQNGFVLTNLIQASKAGDPDLMAITASIVTRELVAGPAYGVERARGAVHALLVG